MKNYIQLFVVVALSLIVFNSWIFTQVIASGDFWYFFPSMLHNLSLYPQAWYGVVGNGLGGLGIVYQNPVIVFALTLKIVTILGLSWPFVAKMLLYIPFIIICIFSSVFLIRKVLPGNNLWLFAPIIFLFNTYSLMLVGGGQILLALSYSLMPLVIYLFTQSISSSKKRLFLYSATGLILGLQILLDLRIAFITFISAPIYFIVLNLSDFKPKFLPRRFLGLVAPLVIAGLIHAFWIFPTLIYGMDPIKALGVDYSGLGIVNFLSFARLENTIALLHPYWPENIFGKVSFMKPSFLILPILAFSSLLFIKKEKVNKFVLYFAILGLVGIFLGKGTNEPFGSLYLWLFSHIPGFQLFRDSFKWYTLIAISYSILIPFTINAIYEWIQSQPKFQILNFKFPHFTKVSRGKQFSIKSKFFNFQNLFALLVTVYFLFLLKPAILGQLPGTFRKQSIPAEYKQLESYLTQDKTFYRTLWIPNTQLFGYYSNNNPEISGRDFFREYDQNKLLKKFDSLESQQLLNYSGVKYVIVPQDSEKEIYLTDRKPDPKKYQKVVNSIDEISWIKKEKEFGKIAVYKTQIYKDHFWCDCGASISYRFINPTKYKVEVQNFKNGDKLIFSEGFDSKWVASNSEFSVNSVEFNSKFNSFEIPSGNYSFIVSYSPQKYVDWGVKISITTILVCLSLLIYQLVKKVKKE